MAHQTVVIGGSGFLGCHLCAALEGTDFQIIDDLRAEDPLRLRPYGRGHERLTLKSYEAMMHAIASSDPKVIFHLAVDPLRQTILGGATSALLFTVGLAQLVDLLVREKWRGRFVYVSSSEVHGEAPPPHSAAGPFAPITPYAASKFAAERVVVYAARHWGLDAVVARPFNMYGPWAHYEEERGELIPRFMLCAAMHRSLPVYGAETTRDFLHVEDAARGLLAVAAKGWPGEAYVLASGNMVSVADIVQRVRKLAGYHLPIKRLAARPGDTRVLRGDISETTDRLGWEPRISFDEGLLATWEWLQTLGPEAIEKMAAFVPELAYRRYS